MCMLSLKRAPNQIRYYYRPNNSSSYTTGKKYKQTSGRSTGGARTSQTIGRGVAELYNVIRLVRNVGT
jgi:hypothetical protein